MLQTFYPGDDGLDPFLSTGAHKNNAAQLQKQLVALPVDSCLAADVEFVERFYDAMLITVIERRKVLISPVLDEFPKNVSMSF